MFLTYSKKHALSTALSKQLCHLKQHLLSSGGFQGNKHIHLRKRPSPDTSVLVIHAIYELHKFNVSNSQTKCNGSTADERHTQAPRYQTEVTVVCMVSPVQLLCDRLSAKCINRCGLGYRILLNVVC